MAAVALIAASAPCAVHVCALSAPTTPVTGAVDGGAPNAAETLAGFRAAPEFLSLFAPRVHREAYRAFVSPLSIGDVIRRLAGDPLRLHPPGAWEPSAALPFDAFGEAGTYDRFKLARLYGASRPRVARGPRGTPAAVTESWTLISPYPDPGLARLEPGTLLIVLTVPQR